MIIYQLQLCNQCLDSFRVALELRDNFSISGSGMDLPVTGKWILSCSNKMLCTVKILLKITGFRMKDI